MTDIITPPRPAFAVRGAASVKHLNVRKEGPEDDKVLAVDIKMEIRGIDRSLCGYFDDALAAFLWRGDTDTMIVRNSFAAPIGYINEISEATVTINGAVYNGCDVKRFHVVPRDGGVLSLTCSVSLFPTATEVSALAKLVQDDCDVEILGPLDLFAVAAVAPSSSDVVITLLGPTA